MGDLKNQIFLQYINRAIDQARAEFIEKNVPKKENRFLVKGITYEIAPCKLDNGKFVCEISSKIPQEIAGSKAETEQYYRKVVKIMSSAGKRPSETKMENITHSSSAMEHKERDYVKLLFAYDEKEFYTLDEVEKRFRRHQAKGIPFPEISGVTTPSGRLVIAIVEEKMGKFIRQNVADLVHANDEVKKLIKATPARPSKKAPKVAAQKAPVPAATVRKPPKKAPATGRKR
jgi:hypothetical protein